MFSHVIPYIMYVGDGLGTVHVPNVCPELGTIHGAPSHSKSINHFFDVVTTSLDFIAKC